MKMRSDSRAQNSPSPVHHRPSGGTAMETVLGFPVNANQPNVMGFPVSQNQFQMLSENEVQESEFSQEQKLEDPRKTRAQRLQISSRVEG